MFTRVEPQHAGPSAIGILIPQGTKTLVIVRPRALDWDLLPARWAGESSQPPQFCVFTRDEAAGVARRFVPSLETALGQGIDPVQTFGHGDRLQIWVRTDEFVWIVCRRVQGQPYQPLILTSLEEAIREGEKLVANVCPACSARQEYYFNTQNLSH